MESKMEPKMNELPQAVSKLALAQQQLARQAEQLYSVEVDSILRDKCRDPQRIERLLDGILDFCFDDEMLRLFKKLCRYYFKNRPRGNGFLCPHIS
jgi:nitric oxide reductase activation protein